MQGNDQHKKLLIEREIIIRRARGNFWQFCKALAPDFYTDDKPPLIKLCNVLQLFYERKLYTESGELALYLMVNMFPRSGKSRTFTHFSAWILGRNQSERVICGSYNDDTAVDFSRYTRDIIMETRTSPFDIVYSDIFPTVKLKAGNKSLKKWALVGQHFNYKGTGVGGSATGKGCTFLLIDDPIKGFAEANNPNILRKVWKWITGTLFSRKEKEALTVLNMTRWGHGDPAYELEQLDVPLYIFEVQAADKVGGTVHFPSMITQRQYIDLYKTMDEQTFRANYHCITVNEENLLYKRFKTYTTLPKFNKIIAYTDTADEGSDFLCTIIAGEAFDSLYVLEIVFTNQDMEQTDYLVANALYSVYNRFEMPIECVIESNNGGKAFALLVERIIQKKFFTTAIQITWFHQSKNKISRILSNAFAVMRYVHFPENWNEVYPDFYNNVTTLSRVKMDIKDAADTLTGLIETHNESLRKRIR